MHGTCHHDCPDSCGWHVTVQDGHRRAAARQPRASVQRGRAVPEGQPVHRPRLRPGPHHHAAAPGRAQRVRAGSSRSRWDEALDEIGTRFTDDRPDARRRGDHAVPHAGNQSLLAIFFGDRFWQRLGASRVLGALCGAVAGAGAAIDQRHQQGARPAASCAIRKLIILWGTNTRLTNRHLWPIIDRGPRRRRPGRRHRPDPHHHRRRRRLVHPAAARHRRRLDAGDDARPDPRRPDRSRVGRRSRSRLRRAGRARRRVDAAARRDDLRRSTPPTSRSWPRAYGTTRPAAIRTLIGAEHHEHGAMFFRTLACLPALVGAWRDRGGGFARSVGVWGERARRRARAQPARPAPARTCPAALDMSPPGRGADRPDDVAAGARDGDDRRQPDGGRAQRRARSPGPDPRRPVHRGARAVHDRLGDVRRHRAAGHHADRVDRRRHVVGSPVPRLERGGDRAASASRSATASCTGAWPRRWGSPSRRCSTTT